MGENDLPASFKPTTSRYMAATESAKAKFRSLGSPQNRTEGDESPRKHQKRLSLNGVAQISKPMSPAPRAKSISQVTGHCCSTLGSLLHLPTLSGLYLKLL